MVIFYSYVKLPEGISCYIPASGGDDYGFIMFYPLKTTRLITPTKNPSGCEWMFSWYVHTGLMELGKPSPKKE